MNKRNLLIGAVVAVLAVVLVIFSINRQGTDDTQDEVIRIGAVIALTGYGADYGESEANAIEMLKEKYPRAKFFVEDSRSSVDSGLSAARKLISLNNIDILYCDLSNITNAIIPLTEESTTILLAPVFLANLVSRGDLTIRNFPSAKQEAEILLESIAGTLTQSARLLALGSNDEFGKSSTEVFKEAAASMGYSNINLDLIPNNTERLASFVSSIIAVDPEVIYLASLNPSIGSLIKSLRENGYNGRILSTNAFSFDYIQDAAGDAAETVTFTEFPKTEAFLDFDNKYKGRFGKAAIPTAVICYDGLSISIDAMLTANRNPENAIALIEDKTFQTIYGETPFRYREIQYPLNVVNP